MISSSCNFGEFINAVKNNDYYDILYKAEQEATEAERCSYRGKITDKDKELCGKQYASILKNFLFYMQYGIKVRGISDYQFQLFQSVRQSIH